MQISSHWRSIHTNMWVPSILVNIWTSLHWIIWFHSISTCMRHSLVLETVILWEERILILMIILRSNIFMCIYILINHHVMVESHHIWIISIRWRSFVLMICLTICLIKLFIIQLTLILNFLLGFKLIAQPSRRNSNLKLLQVYIKISNLNICMVITSWS